MANSKISALTAATTPLAGTEVLPIVQSSATKKVAVSSMFGTNVYTFLNTPSSANLAAAVTDETGSGALVFGTNPTFYNSGSSNPSANFTNSIYQDVLVNFFNAAGTVGNKITVQFASNGGATTTNAITSYGSAMGGGLDNAIEMGNSNGKVRVTTAGDALLTTGNLIQGTAAKGVNFTANTPAAGMTSQLLNWYEEGTWTPNQGGGLTVVGAFSSAGTYTRIGRQVFIQGSVSGATSVAVASAGAISTNLPYSSAADTTGAAINAANNASSVIRVSSATLTAATVIAATATITFSAVYSV